MKAVIVLLILLTADVMMAVSAQLQGYQSKYGNINVDAILNNPRVVKSYVNCFLDRGPCTPQGREGKKFFPEIYKTNCSKCTEEQKMLIKKTVKAFYAKQKEDWNKIVDKYDSKHEHNKEFLKWVMESEKS